jgi:hypothetical protein
MTLAERAAALSQEEIISLLKQNQALAQQTADLQRQVEWFKRQLFGRKSERRLRGPDAQQLPLAGLLPARSELPDAPPPLPRPSKPINVAPVLPPSKTRPMKGGYGLTASFR